jgi:plasmid stabilization system protein ParE
MARLKIEWSLEARLDLIDILEFYIERNGTATYSRKLNSKIKENIKLISKKPLLGTKTDFINVRALVVNDYQIIYEIYDELILIIMIWDCRRNPDDKRIGSRIKS